MNPSYHQLNSKQNISMTKQTVRTMCPMNCHPTLCGMQVTVENDNLLSISGDPENPDSKGFLCLRGKAAHEIIGNQQRLLHPLIRNNRNTQDWQEISVETAMNQIVSQLTQHEPVSFGIWLGHGDAATNYGTRLGGMLSRRFAHMLGCQWWHPAMICWGLAGFGFGLTGLLDVHTKEDMSAHSDLILLWGANIVSQPNTGPHIRAARKRGAKIISIDIRKSEAAALADDSYLIKPGTDAALALGMMHVLINESLINSDYIAKHTIGFEQLKAHIASYDTEWAAEITGLNPEHIKQLAREYATTPLAMILIGGSSMHKNQHGWQAARAISCLPALTGKIGIPGSGLGPRHGAKTTGQELNSALPEYENRCRHPIPNQMEAMLEALETGRIKTLLLSGTDMSSSFADSNRLKQGLEQVELIICHDLFANDTIREYADIVLPASAWLEQIGCKMTNTHLYFMEQALPAPDDAQTLSQMLQTLANALGLDDFFPWSSDEEFIDVIINHPSTGHATVEQLRNDGGIQELNISHVANPDHRFPTPSGKVELYSQQAKVMGLPPLPVYQPADQLESFPLHFRQGRTIKHFHAFYDHGQALPALKKHNKQPELWLAIEDAEPRSIQNGDEIVIFNHQGRFRAEAIVTDKIPSGTVWMRDGWSGINSLTSSQRCVPDAVVDRFAFSAGQAAYDAYVDVERIEAS